MKVGTEGEVPEPFRIKMTEPIRLLRPEARADALELAGLEKYLIEHEIPYTAYRHEPIVTCSHWIDDAGTPLTPDLICEGTL
jgi:hypothetical protein